MNKTIKHILVIFGAWAAFVLLCWMIQKNDILEAQAHPNYPNIERQVEKDPNIDWMEYDIHPRYNGVDLWDIHVISTPAVCIYIYIGGSVPVVIPRAAFQAGKGCT